MGIDGGAAWVVVLVKDFDSAKQRLGPALDPEARRDLALHNARLALEAARAGDRALAVCGSPEAGDLALAAGLEVIVEVEPRGQNQAAQAGIEHARLHDAEAVLLLSSDLPLVTPGAVGAMLEACRRLGSPAVVAAPATGRGGTNALYLRPPDAVRLHFGDDSLRKFRADASKHGVRFGLHEDRDLALDLDEPADLEALAQRR